MRSRFALLLAIAAVCVATAWAGWSPEQQVTNNGTTNWLRMYNGNKVVVAADGVRHLVWDRGGVYYKRWYPTSGWTSDYQLTTIKASQHPAIALDANGTDIHVVWQGQAGSGRSVTQHIYYQKCVPGSSGNGGWVGSPMDLTPDAGGRPRWHPAVACYQGHVVVTWEDAYGDSVGFRECVDGCWGAPVLLDISAGTGQYANVMAFYPCIAVDPQARYGDVFILAAVCYDWSRAYVMRRQNGEWQPAECAIDGADFAVFYPVIEVDPSTGCPHIVCGTMSYLNIYHTCWDPSLGWLPTEMISDPSAIADRFASMCFSTGSAFVTWAEQSSQGVSGIRYSIGQYGNWSTPAWVTSGYSDDFPRVTARSNGDVHFIWEDVRKPKQQIWGRLYTPGSGGGMGRPVVLMGSGVELFPNPTKAGRVTVQYSLPRAGEVTIALLDVSGRAVRSSQFEVPSSKEGSFSLDASGLNPGVYIVKLEAGTTSLTRKLVIQ